MKQFKYTNLFKDQGSQKAVLILQGGNFGVDTDFIQAVFNKSVEQGFTTLAYNFPYYDRGEEVTSEDCKEEVSTIHEALNFLLSTDAKEVMVVAKSVGSVVLGVFLRESPTVPIHSIVILGVPLKYVELTDYKNQTLQIIQGDLDKFGDAKVVEAAATAAGIKPEIIAIAEADHSFRGEHGEEPGKQIDAISKIDWKVS